MESLDNTCHWKILRDFNHDKRLQTFGRITTYPYGTNAFKVCER